MKKIICTILSFVLTYDDVVTLYKLPSPVSSNVRGKIMMSTGPDLLGYIAAWDAKA